MAKLHFKDQAPINGFQGVGTGNSVPDRCNFFNC